MNTIAMSLLLSALLLALALLVRRQIARKGVGTLQNTFEMFMEQLCSLTREIVRTEPEPYVPLVGTLFLFVFLSNLMGIIPGLSSPTRDISVSAALAAVVFLSVPFYGIHARGLKAYLRSYLKPNPFMLPFNLLGELTRTLALAVRLFGNIMSGELLFLIIVGVVMEIMLPDESIIRAFEEKNFTIVFIPFTFVLTLFISVLGLITAAIQAYIFTVLSLVYIGGAVQHEAVRERDGAEQQATEGAQ
jgi:F-type H+-transporting ATPase subunit a